MEQSKPQLFKCKFEIPFPVEKDVWLQNPYWVNNLSIHILSPGKLQ